MATVIVLKGEKGVRALAEQVDDLKPAMTQIGAYLVSKTQARFRTQDQWWPRMNPNVPGIVGDLNKGSEPPGRRFKDRPALIDTGLLRSSWTFLAKRREVTVGTKVRYADLHQTGGRTRKTLTKFGQDNLTLFLRKRPELRQDLGWLFSEPTFVVNVRKRTMLAVTKEDLRVIDGILEDYLAQEA